MRPDAILVYDNILWKLKRRTRFFTLVNMACVYTTFYFDNYIAAVLFCFIYLFTIVKYYQASSRIYNRIITLAKFFDSISMRNEVIDPVLLQALVLHTIFIICVYYKFC